MRALKTTIGQGLVAALALSALGATTTSAAEPQAAMQSFLEQHILGWAQDAVIVGAIAAQNVDTAGYDQAQIDALDLEWREQVGTGSSDLVGNVLNGDAAAFLQQHVGTSDGAITEIFIMDAHGLNVAASGPTSDYWQGDEAKFQQTYGVGPTAVHFSEVEFDESSQSYQAQISLTITDPATGAAIGAMTVGVNAEHLM